MFAVDSDLKDLFNRLPVSWDPVVLDFSEREEDGEIAVAEERGEKALKTSSVGRRNR